MVEFELSRQERRIGDRWNLSQSCCFPACWLVYHCFDRIVIHGYLDGLSRRLTLGTAKFPGIRIHGTRMIRLMEALLHGGTTVGGRTPKQVHQAILPAFELSLQTYSLNQLGYDLRKLKGHGPLPRDGRR